jgi:hypothetical protein
MIFYVDFRRSYVELKSSFHSYKKIFVELKNDDYKEDMFYLHEKTFLFVEKKPLFVELTQTISMVDFCCSMAN